jgi:signal transduction histidine kinase
MNLVQNAVDAMGEVPPPKRRIDVRTDKYEPDGVEVAVSDVGPGIPRDKLQRLFESFYTTKKEGMGLGLSIARSIIEAHRGRLWAENRDGGGATFRFFLPLHTPKAATAGASSSVASPPVTHGA